MELSEYPLLNRPALMLTVPHAAERGPATLEDCRRHLAAALAAAQERPPPVDAAALLAELDLVRRHLLVAGLLAPAEDGAFTLTPRGAATLAAHRDGVDESVL